MPPPLASPEIGARVCLQACIPPRGKKPTFSRGGTLIDSPLARILITERSIYSLRSFSIFFSKVVAPFAPCTYFFSNGIFFELFSIFVNDILEHIIIIIFFFSIKKPRFRIGYNREYGYRSVQVSVNISLEISSLSLNHWIGATFRCFAIYYNGSWTIITSVSDSSSRNRYSTPPLLSSKRYSRILFPKYLFQLSTIRDHRITNCSSLLEDSN